MIARLPLGALQTRLSTKAGSILADIRQRGQLATTSVRGSVSFPRHVGMLPDFGQAVLATTASAKDIDIGMLAPLLPSSAEGVGGKLNLDLIASGAVSQLRGKAEFNLVHGFVRKDRIDELAGQVTSDAGGIRVPRLRARMNGASLVAQGTLTRDHRLRAHAVVATSEVATLTRVANVTSPIKGAMSVALDAAGSLQQPLFHALLKAAPGSVYGVAYDGITADANYAPGRIAVRSANTQLSGRRGSLALEGTVPIPFGPQPAQRNHLRRPMAMRFVASGIDLAAFDPLLHGQGTLAGTFDLNARAQGSLAKPKLSGNATLRDAAIRSKRETVPLTALNADVSSFNDAIIMPSLRGKLGGGTIAASAFGRLQPPTRSNPVGTLAYAMRLVADRANLTVPQLFSGVVSAQLALQSNHGHPSFAGGVTLENTQVPFAGILALASGSSSGEPAQAARVPGVPPLRQGHFIWFAGSIYGDQPHVVAAIPPAARVHVPSAAPVALNVDINAAKNVAVTGLVNATGEGTVHLGGTAAAPKLKGALRTIRGEIGAFDTIFHLERGRVSFHPADGFLPTVSAKAVAERPEAEITVTISGRVDRMRTQLESDPPMPQAAILADMLHINQIDAALNGGAASGGGQPTLAKPGGVAQNLASAALTGKLLSAINYGLEQSLDISEVDFAFDSHGQPSLELRKQYGKNLYALFRTSFQVPPEQSVGIAYDLRDALEMEFVQKQNTAGQSIAELTQTTSFQVNVRFP